MKTVKELEDLLRYTKHSNVVPRWNGIEVKLEHEFRRLKTKEDSLKYSFTINLVGERGEKLFETTYSKTTTDLDAPEDYYSKTCEQGALDALIMEILIPAIRNYKKGEV